METVEKSIDVEAPITAVYNQWTQFEEFPRFMEGVKEVRQLDNKRLHWKAEIAGKLKEWDAEIFEQIPDQRIAWRSVAGPLNTRFVGFTPITVSRTRIGLRLNYQPEGTVEKMGDALGVVSRRIEGDLERFRDFIEARGHETGGWRGQIHGREVTSTGERITGTPATEPRSKRLRTD